MEQKQVVVECDKCGKYIENLSAFDGKLYKGRIEDMKVTYFSCPHCGYKYPIMLVDSIQEGYNMKVLYLQRRVKKSVTAGRPIDHRITDRLNQLLIRSKDHQAALRNTFLTAVTDQLNKSDNTETNS